MISSIFSSESTELQPMAPWDCRRKIEELFRVYAYSYNTHLHLRSPVAGTPHWLHDHPTNCSSHKYCPFSLQSIPLLSPPMAQVPVGLLRSCIQGLALQDDHRVLFDTLNLEYLELCMCDIVLGISGLH